MMTVNEAYLFVHGATVTLNYIPVMTPGLYDKFPAPTETLPGQKKSRKWTDMPKECVSSTWAIQICLICNHYRIILQFQPFGFPGISGNVNAFLSPFPGIQGRYCQSRE